MQDLGQNSQDARDAIKELFAEITKNKPTLNAMVVDVSSMTAGFNKMSKEMQLSGTLAKDLERTYKNSNTLVASIQAKLKETNATQAEAQAAVERIKNINQNSLDIASNMETTVGSLYKLEVARATGLTGIYASQAAEYSLMVEKGLLTKEQYENHLKDLKLQEKMQQHLDDNLALNEQIAAQIVEIREETESWKKSFDKVNATAKAIATDPKTLAFFAFNEGVKGLEKMHHTFHDMHEMGLSAGQAMEGTFKQMDITSMDWWLGLSDTQGVMKGIVSEYGNVNALSKETVSQLGKMATSFGISGEEAAQLNAQLSQMPGETSETAANAMQTVGDMAKMQGVAPGKIMKDMAKNSAAMALYSKDGAKGFGKAAIELHKMGVEIGTAAKMADGLLDFENSINKQMEASVLLGKEINLDKAREAALNGDLETATSEVLKNVGGAAEFEKMNVLQKKALAEATGMTVEELQKSIDAQEESNKYFGEGSSIGMNALGYMMQYGGAAAGFFKENGMLLMTSVQFMSQFGILQKLSNGLTAAGNFLMSNRYVAATAHWAKEKAQWVAEKAHMLWKAAAEKMGFASKAAGATSKVAGGAAEAGGKMLGKGADLASSASDSASKVKTGGGFKGAMKDLADGFRQMGGADVIKGILNTALAGPALIVALPSIPFLLFMGLTPLKLLESNFMGLAQGLGNMGTGKAAMGSLNLMLFGVAGVVGVAAIPFMAFMAFAGQLVGAGLKGLAKGMEALAKPQVALGAVILMGLALSLGASVMMMGIGIGIAAAGLSLMFKELANMPIEQMMLLPIALQLIGLGLLTLGVGALVAAPGLFFATWALAGFAAVLALMQPIMEMGGLTAIAEGLVSIAANAGGLAEVGLAVMGIGAGLGAMALAGLMALPIIGALVGLAAVAPALGALGSLFGGGGDGGGKDDKMDKVVEKLDQLIAVASKGGEVKMDGKKVGEVIRLGLNTSNVR